jgi:ABC-2 type transport system ATP-binding protein
MLVAQQLTKSFGARVAVENVSFDIAAGEIFALVGPNGAGKTTTLRMLAGLISPSSGAVQFGGEPMATSSSSLRAGIGFLTESPGLWDRLTVRQNLRVHAALHGLPHPARAVDAAMDLFGVRDRAGEAAAVLSKGLRQRGALARALLHDPRVVLLDEPTSGLDPESARDVRELVLRLRHERRAVLISTHNLDEVDRLANRVALLKTRLVALDTPERLRARVFGSRVRITLAAAAGAHASALRAAGIADVREQGPALSIGLDDNAFDTPALVRRLVEGGAAIESVEREEPSLEQVYLRLMTREERP